MHLGLWWFLLLRRISLRAHRIRARPRDRRDQDRPGFRANWRARYCGKLSGDTLPVVQHFIDLHSRALALTQAAQETEVIDRQPVDIIQGCAQTSKNNI